MKRLPFSHDYPKLRDNVFTSIRRSDRFGEEGEIIEATSPNLPPFKAIVLYKTWTDFDQLSDALLMYDTGKPSREEALDLLQSFYQNPIEAGWLYLLKKVEAVKR